MPRQATISQTLAGLLGVISSTAAAQQPSGVEATLRSEQATRAAISWEPARLLSWTDFRGPPPTTPGAEGAATSSGMLLAIECNREHLEYGVLTVFTPSESWVKAVVLHDSAESTRILPHEQGHFDLSEIEARLLRAELMTFAVPCAAADTAFTTLARAAFARLQTLEVKYDAETGNGIVPAAQARWQTWIHRTLDSLSFVTTPWIARKY